MGRSGNTNTMEEEGGKDEREGREEGKMKGRGREGGKRKEKRKADKGKKVEKERLREDMKKSFPFSRCSTRMSSNCSLWEVRTGAVSSTYTHTVITRSFTVVCGRRRRVRVEGEGGG